MGNNDEKKKKVSVIYYILIVVCCLYTIILQILHPNAYSTTLIIVSSVGVIASLVIWIKQR